MKKENIETSVGRNSLQAGDRKNSRSSNLEILRIISIIMIIMHHYAIYSGFEFENSITINRIVVNFFEMFGKLGVCLFIIISGYFYDKSKFKFKKLVRLLLQVFIYAIISLAIGIITNSERISGINILKSILPTTFGLYWFVSCYVLIYIFTPFFRKIVENISKKDFKILLTFMIIVWGIIGFVPKTKTFFSEIVWLIVIYLIGTYIKKYNCNIFKNNKTRIFVIILFVAIMNIIMIFLEGMARTIPKFEEIKYYFNNLNSPLVLILTVLIFNIFKNLNIKSSKLINKVASTTFGIYLIHENVFLRDIIWKQLIQGSTYINSPMLILNAIFGVISVFLCAMVIDFVIERIIINNLIKIISKIYYKIKQMKVYTKIENKVLQFYNN